MACGHEHRRGVDDSLLFFFLILVLLFCNPGFFGIGDVLSDRCADRC